jgi:hypothetical protein
MGSQIETSDSQCFLDCPWILLVFCSLGREKRPRRIGLDRRSPPLPGFPTLPNRRKHDEINIAPHLS